MKPERFKYLRRYSLRTLFVLMTLCCVLFGTWAAYVKPYRLQMQSLNSAKLPEKGPGWHRWLVTTLLGEEAFVRVTEVDLAPKKVNDDALRSLGGLIYLEKLSLDYTPVADAGLATLRSMQNLQHVSLRYTDISDRGAEHLATLPNLRTAFLTGTKITDAGAQSLAKNQGMTELYIRWTQITDDGADRLAAALPECAVHHHALTP
jgi:hypothetical protein